MSSTNSQPGYSELAVNLGVADGEARAAGRGAKDKRDERNTVAVDTIKAAYREKILTDTVHTDLLGAGVLKGTVSKIEQILDALKAGVLSINDIKSLNGAYNLVKAAEKATADAVNGTGSGASTATAAEAKPEKALTPDQAWKIILGSIEAETDADAQRKLASKWTTKITNAISKVVKATEAAGEAE